MVTFSPVPSSVPQDAGRRVNPQPEQILLIGGDKTGMIAGMQQDGAAARIECKQHAIGSAGMLNPKFLHVRVPRRMNHIGVRLRKAWSEFLH